MIADAARGHPRVGGEVWGTGDDMVEQGRIGAGMSRVRDELAQREATEQLRVCCNASLVRSEDVEIEVSERIYWLAFGHDVDKLVVQIVDCRC